MFFFFELDSKIPVQVDDLHQVFKIFEVGKITVKAKRAVDRLSRR